MPEIKFAVVREDPCTEIRLLQHLAAKSILMVASGGCTALAVKHTRPDIDVVAYDFNPAQIEHVRHKNQSLPNPDRRCFNVEDADPRGLNQCGAFERLFRVLRASFIEWIAPANDLALFFGSWSQNERVLAGRIPKRSCWTQY